MYTIRKYLSLINRKSLFVGNLPKYYRYAQENIHCECPKCRCPGAGGKQYSFVYINESKNFIFYDVPKAASSFIRTKLIHADEIIQSQMSLIDPQKELNQYFKFTFVRNPWDRLISNWKMFTNRPLRIKQLKSMTNKDLTKFEDFVLFAKETKNHHWQPQVLFLPDKLDFIGKVENFKADIEEICRKVGVTGLNTTEKINRTDHLPYKEYYSKSLIDLVSEMYKDDIERFSYSFD